MAGGKDGQRRENKCNSCRKENNWLGNIRDGEEKKGHNEVKQ